VLPILILSHHNVFRMVTTDFSCKMIALFILTELDTFTEFAHLCVRMHHIISVLCRDVVHCADCSSQKLVSCRQTSRLCCTSVSSLLTGCCIISLCLSLALSVCLSLRFNGHFSRWTWVSRLPECLHSVFIGAKDDGNGADNWSYTTCKAPVKSSPP